MSKIIRLPSSVVKRIAAGEVVERPASVLKELVENSIDAEATSIKVELKSGGKTLIKVWDDGVGMDEEDAFLSLQRHTTSKISAIEDLEQINTFGFRGEALYAISSVSIFELVTKTADDELATRIVAEGGMIKDISKIHRVTGTTVSVKSLFFNLKARRRFLRSSSVELSHCIDIFKSFAVSFPEIAFELKVDGKLRYKLPPMKLTDRIRLLYDADSLSVAEVEDNVVKLNIYAISGRDSFIKLFVNGRYVFDRSVAAFLRGLSKGGSFNAFILFINVPPYMVDVNVHPSKREVKFRDKELIYKLLDNAFKKFQRKTTGTYADSTVFQEEFAYSSRHRYRFLGEYACVYLVYESSNGDMILVDKHALHERIIYDKIVNREKFKLQPVYIPVDIDKLHVISMLKEFLDYMGFEFSEEHRAFVSVPEWAYVNPEGVVKYIIKELEGENIKNISYEYMARIACRAAVKMGDTLYRPDIEYITGLLDRAYEITCPHGRPVIVKIEKRYFDKLFKRRQ